MSGLFKPCKGCKSKNSELHQYRKSQDIPFIWYLRVCVGCGYSSESAQTEVDANINWNTRQGEGGVGMDYKVEYIGGDEAIVTFEGSIHIDCRNNLDRDFKDALDILINKYAI